MPDGSGKFEISDGSTDGSAIGWSVADGPGDSSPSPDGPIRAHPTTAKTRISRERVGCRISLKKTPSSADSVPQ
jgi:hypothetical protein